MSVTRSWISLFCDWHFDDTEVFIVLQSYIVKFFRVVEGVEVFNVGVEPEFRGFREGAEFLGFVVAGNLLFDAGDLVLVDVGVVRDEGELAGFHANAVGD